MYHYPNLPLETEYKSLNEAAAAICNKLTKSTTHELWHNRLGHPGTNKQTNKILSGLNCSLWYSPSLILAAPVPNGTRSAAVPHMWFYVKKDCNVLWEL